MLGLYRGVIPKIVGGLVGNATSTKVTNHLKEYMKETEEAMSEKNQDDVVFMAEMYLFKTAQEVSARCMGIIVSQPFHVIMLRSMAQFIGKEEIYAGIFSSTKEIYNHDGILGFFAGLVPRLIGEVTLIMLTNFLSTLVNRYLVVDKEMQSYSPGACGFLIQSCFGYIYGCQLISNLMAINGSGLAAAKAPYMPEYANWVDCWRHLKKQGLLKRGSQLIFRVCTEV